MGFELVRDNSVLEPLHSHSAGQWSRNEGSGGGKVSLSNGGTSIANGNSPKCAGNTLGPEILALIDAGESKERGLSLFFQLKHNDNLYTRYFKHMNAGRVKVTKNFFKRQKKFFNFF